MPFNLSAAVGALAVYKLALGPKALARGAVHSLVLALVYIALFIELLKIFATIFVVRVSGSYELIICGVKYVANGAYFARHLIDILLRRHTGLFCIFFNLLTVLVRSRKENTS